MQQYLDLLRHVLQNGVRKPTRTKSQKTGNELDALSVFGYQLRFDLAAGFPAVTTKRLPIQAVAHELRWFLQGDTNVKYLKDNGVHIWDAWADENGELGPIYGRQWRAWPCPDGSTVDQIARLLDGIEEVKNNPKASIARRLVISAWNVADVPRMKLPPCHLLCQFSVTEGRLSCLMYQRSADVFLGVPFNIASYALLTHLVARATKLEVGEFVHMFGDVHIYENLAEQVKMQLAREPYPLPKLLITPEVKGLFDWTPDQISLDEYKHHPAIPGDVAV